MQIPKHFPAVGLVTLVLVGAAAGSLYYYQFLVPHERSCGTPAHRLVFLKAVIQEDGGFTITGAALLNQSGPAAPSAHNQTYPAFNFTGVSFENYTVSSPKLIQANKGDTITVYMESVSVSDPAQYSPNPPLVGLGHGFGIQDFTIPQPVRLVTWGNWGSTTFTVNNAGSFTFRCLHSCSDGHGQMTGSLAVAGCG